MIATIADTGIAGMSRTWLFRLSALALLVAILAVPSRTLAAERQSTQASDGPVEMVRQTSDAMLELIEEAKGYAEENPERFYRQVESLLSPVVDFEGFARGVMSVYWRDASPEQRQKFTETFKWGLVRTYALALTDFNDGKVVVTPPDRPPRNPQRQTVKMEIHTPGGDVYPVLYSVVQSDNGDWQVRNIIVNGVNMGLTYRQQFRSAMNDPKYGGDLDRVIDAWGDLLKAEGSVVDQVTEEQEA